MTCAVHVLPLHTAKLHPFCTIIQSISAATQREEAANEGSWSYSHYSAGWACRAVTCVT